MTARENALGQPIGWPVPDWTPPPLPPETPMQGRFCKVEPLSAEAHAEALYTAYVEDREGRMWTYLAEGPFANLAACRAWLQRMAADESLFTHTIHDAHGPAGVASYLRAQPKDGSIEVGWIALSPRLQRTPAATEAMALMMGRAFDLGYRRYEWKCDALNAPSRRAAERLGFVFEGIFRQATVYRNRNRDTAWFAILDRDWPARSQAFDGWLSPKNFDGEGRQKRRLSEFL